MSSAQVIQSSSKFSTDCDSDLTMRENLLKSTFCLMGLALLMTFSGCAAFHPIRGIPAAALDETMKGPSRSHATTIDLSLLGQTPPMQHLVGARDVLGIYIEGVLGNPGEAPPINVPQDPELPPSIGYPITVRDDGTISLPMIGSLPVNGLTIRQVEETLRKIYTLDRNILKPGHDRIIVSLQRPRKVKVLVLRQETGGGGGTEFAQGLSINLGQTKRGNGQVVHLPIYKNDVLHALARTGGLPGLDAENMIYIIRRKSHPHQLPAGPGIGPAAYPGNHPVPPVMPGVTQAQHSQFQRAQFQQAQGIQLVNYQPNSASPFASSQSIQQKAAEPWHRLPNRTKSTQKFVTPEPAHTVNREMTVVEELAVNSEPMLSLPPERDVPRDVPTPINSDLLSESELQSLQPTGSNYQWGQPNEAPLKNMEFRSGNYSPQAPITTIQPPVMHRPQSQLPDMPQAPMLNTLQPPVNVQRPPQQYIAPAPQMQSVPHHSGWTPQQRQPQPTLPPSFASAYSSLPWEQMDAGFPWNTNDPTMKNHQIIKIPVRLKPGEQPNIRPQDVILHDGDIVFIESRETEIYYTGGLLGGGQFTLPRDYDLDVLGAIAIAQGTNQQQAGNQIGGVSAINGDVTISASNVIILRMLPDGSQIPIKVDLYRALRDPCERVLIQPGDIVMLRYKPLEAVGAFIERNLLESAIFGLAAAQLPSNN